MKLFWKSMKEVSNKLPKCDSIFKRFLNPNEGGKKRKVRVFFSTCRHGSPRKSTKLHIRRSMNRTQIGCQEFSLSRLLPLTSFKWSLIQNKKLSEIWNKVFELSREAVQRLRRKKLLKMNAPLNLNTESLTLPINFIE